MRGSAQSTCASTTADKPFQAIQRHSRVQHSTTRLKHAEAAQNCECIASFSFEAVCTDMHRVGDMSMFSSAGLVGVDVYMLSTVTCEFHLFRWPSRFRLQVNPYSFCDMHDRLVCEDPFPIPDRVESLGQASSSSSTTRFGDVSSVCRAWLHGNVTLGIEKRMKIRGIDGHWTLKFKLHCGRIKRSSCNEAVDHPLPPLS